jgi:hypothetical protein
METVIAFCAGKSAGPSTATKVTAYLAKPYSPRGLLEIVRHLLPEGQGAEG